MDQIRSGYYQLALIKELLNLKPSAVKLIAEDCWLPFLRGSVSMLPRRTFVQIIETIDFIDNSLLKEKILPLLFNILDNEFKSSGFLHEYPHIKLVNNLILELCK